MTAGPINWKYIRIGEYELTARTFNLLRNNGMEIPGEVKELLAAYKRSMPDETGGIHGARCLTPLLKKNSEKLDGVVFPRTTGPS